MDFSNLRSYPKARIEDDLLNSKDRPLLLYLADKKQHGSETLLHKRRGMEVRLHIAARDLQLRAPSACEEALLKDFFLALEQGGQ